MKDRIFTQYFLKKLKKKIIIVLRVNVSYAEEKIQILILVLIFVHNKNITGSVFFKNLRDCSKKTTFKAGNFVGIKD